MAHENQAHARTGLHCRVKVIGPTGEIEVGSFEDANFKINEETEEYREIGEPFAARLTSGYTASGSLKKGYIKSTLLKTALPTRVMRGEAVAEGPLFILAFSIQRADARIDVATFYGCKIPSFDLGAKKGKVDSSYEWHCTEGYELSTL